MGTYAIADSDAKVRIREYLKTFRHKKVKRVGIVDIMTTLNLPPDQIERIMTDLKNEGVKEVR